MAQMAASGKAFISGMFTVPNDATTYKLEFGRSFGKYLYFIELADESKTALINSGSSKSKAVAYTGVYPKPAINGGVINYCSTVSRYTPSDGSSTGSSTNAYTVADSYISNNVKDVDVDGNYQFIEGYTYKYFVVSME